MGGSQPPPKPAVTQAMKDEAQRIIQAHGFSCVYVNRLVHLTYETDTTYSVACNEYQYAYTIIDVGGSWFVRVR